MNRPRTLVGLLLSTCIVMAGAGSGSAAARQLQSPKNLAASATSSTSISVTFSSVPGASSYSVFLFNATGKGSTEFPNALPAGTTISGLATCTTYRVSVQAISTSRTLTSSVQSGKIAVTTQCNPALVPSFGTPTQTSDGFTVQITNYDAAFTWAISVTAGLATIDGSGLVTVSGLVDDASQTLTVTTTRATYDPGSATISAARNSTPSRWVGSGDFTIELWVKPTVDWASVGRQELFVLLPTAYNARFDIAYDSGAWTIFDFNVLTAGSVPSPVVMAPPAIGTWTHVALTKQSGTVRLYVAGQKIAESTATFDLTNHNKVLLGADPNTTWCHCNLATALLSNVRVVDGTALYTGATLTIPTSPLTAIAGTTFLLNNALGQPSVGSVEFDGATRYEQAINLVNSVPTVSSFDAYRLVSGSWTPSTVVTSTDSPFNVCGSNGLRASGGACHVGDRGPGGGVIFYVSDTPFTSTGSVCATSCHYLEVAPMGWATLSAVPENTNDYQQQTLRTDANVDPSLIWWYGPSRQPPEGITTGLGIGTGMGNTLALKAATTPDSTPSGQSRFAFDAALNYAAPGTSAGEWFLPSIGELNELCKFANGQTADLGAAVACSPTITGSNVPALGFTADTIYWSSSYPAMDMPYPYGASAVGSLGQTPGYVLRRSSYAIAYLGYYSVYAEYVRPIRAF